MFLRAHGCVMILSFSSSLNGRALSLLFTSLFILRFHFFLPFLFNRKELTLGKVERTKSFAFSTS